MQRMTSSAIRGTTGRERTGEATRTQRTVAIGRAGETLTLFLLVCLVWGIVAALALTTALR